LQTKKYTDISARSTAASATAAAAAADSLAAAEAEQPDEQFMNIN